MAIFDADLMFSDNQAVTATASSETVIDCGQELLTTGLNGAMELFVAVIPTTDFTGTGSIQVSLQHSDTKDGSYSVVKALPDTAATEFKRSLIPMPLVHKQFLKLVYTVTGTVADGKISAGITRSVDMQQDYKAEDYTFQ